MGNLLHGEFGIRERWSTTTFLRLSYLESQDQILEEARSNELVGPWHLLCHKVSQRRMISENGGFGPK